MARSRTAPPDPYATRLANVRAAMAKARIDGLLLLDRHEQFWLTGFSGEDGMVLVTPKGCVLLTDRRFDETADREAPWAQKVLRKVRSAAVTAREIRRHRLGRIGFDARHIDVATHTALSKELRPARLVSVQNLVGRMRLLKDEGEVAAIRRAIRVAEQAFLAVWDTIKPGQPEREIAARLVFEMQSRGAEEPSFPPIVAAGANASLPHYVPGDAPVRANEVLLIDWGARSGWYVSDLTRTMPIGSMPRDLTKAWDAVCAAHAAAIDAVRPGVRAAAVDAVARRIIKSAGFGDRFGHALGHGIGLKVHEPPRLGTESEDELAAGMVVTIEPGIYLPGIGGIRIEDDVLVTASGREVLSALPVRLPAG
ncbi:MAG: Xaa-Pro peptidase family protein [Phycisphaerae bacterium]|nr:aminopeptidase P family protein [Phycisphaerae bacterium]MCZ2401276.1 Xaa-Pro peptidase family protein [Phycisphaerae bacterium]